MPEVATLEKPLETLTVSDTDEVAEFTKLIKDLKAKVIDMKNQLKPLKQKIEEGQIQTSKGVSFLEVKYQVMLQYIMELAYFVHLKICGKQIQGNPVVESLVELRVILDKMKPIEAKLKYQIDKLVRAAVIDTNKKKEQQEGESGSKNEITVAEAVAADPLVFKPNPMNLLNKDDDAEEMVEGAEGDDETGVYRPPKLAPVSYTEEANKKGGKKERDEARYKEKASRSRIMKDLMTEMSENPEEIDVFGGVNEGTGYGDKLDSIIAEKNRYEEDNFVRLAVTRKEKKRLNKNRRMKFESEFENLNDFSNLAGLKDVEEQENERFRNVLNRNKKNEAYEGGSSKRARDNDDDDNFHGLFDGEKKGKNTFTSKRLKKRRSKKRS